MNQPAQRLVGFVHHLRDEGFSIGIQEVMDMLSSLEFGSLTDKRYSHKVMRSLACNNQLDWQRFDQLFIDYWQATAETDDSKDMPPEPAQRGPSRAAATGIGGSSVENPNAMRDLSGLTGSGAGRQRTISKADFRFLNDSRAMREVEKLAELLAMQLNKRLRRKHHIQTHGRRVDLRHTLRRNLSHGGFPAQVYYKNRVREPLHIVILHDVSHSMAWNNPLLFRFARGLVRAFKNSEAFAFHTQLFRVTEYYREHSLHKMKQRLEARNHYWMGGTCIAESIDRFNREYASMTLKSDTVVMIISDGFDTNDPAYLAQELRLIKRAAKKIIWLDPMLGREGYDPDADSMRAAMPYIDRHASAHSLDSLKSTIDYIARECR